MGRKAGPYDCYTELLRPKGQGDFGIAKPLFFPYSAAFPSMGLYNIVRLSTHWVMIQPTPGLDTERLI